MGVPPDSRGGVSDGARTRDTRDHNPVLCQLSYAHHVVDPMLAGALRPDEHGFAVVAKFRD